MDIGREISWDIVTDEVFDDIEEISAYLNSNIQIDEQYQLDKDKEYSYFMLTKDGNCIAYFLFDQEDNMLYVIEQLQ